MKPLDHLLELEVQAAIAKFPNTEPHLTRSCIRRRKQTKANDITKAIIKFLQLSGHQAERINTMGRVIDQRKTFTDVLGYQRQIGSMKYIPTTGTKGSADISATIRRRMPDGSLIGVSVKIEIKAGRDRQRPEQKEYQAAIERAGGVYMIASSFDSFYEWYNNFIKNTT